MKIQFGSDDIEPRELSKEDIAVLLDLAYDPDFEDLELGDIDEPVPFWPTVERKRDPGFAGEYDPNAPGAIRASMAGLSTQQRRSTK